MLQYSDIVQDHFNSPRNAGRLENPSGVGAATGACTDQLTIWIRVRDDHIEAISFQCAGCPASIACGSMVTVLAKGLHLDDAADIADETVTDALGGLPAEKRHCASLAAEALAAAIWDYVVKTVGQAEGEQ